MVSPSVFIVKQLICNLRTQKYFRSSLLCTRKVTFANVTFQAETATTGNISTSASQATPLRSL